MTSFKSYIFLILFLFVEVLLFAGEKPYENTKGITITLSMDTNVFCEMQRVWLIVKFKNEGSFRDSIRNMNIHEGLVIRNESEEILEYKGLMNGQLKSWYFKLEPGEEKVQYTELSDIYGDMKNSFTASSFSPYYSFSTGEYRVSINMILDYRSKKQIISNTLIFEVIKAVGYEEQCLSILKEIYCHSDKTKEERAYILNEYSNFIKEHKQSIYYDEVFSRIVRMRIFTRNIGLDSAILKIQEYLEKNPMSFESKVIAWYYAEACIKFSGIDEAKNKLNDLKTRFPDTRLSEGVDNALKSNLFVH